MAIYHPYVENTAISWEIEVPTVDEMAARIAGLRDPGWLISNVPIDHDALPRSGRHPVTRIYCADSPTQAAGTRLSPASPTQRGQ